MKVKVLCKRVVTVLLSLAMVMATVPADTFAAQVNDGVVDANVTEAAEINEQGDFSDSQICSGTEEIGEADSSGVNADSDSGTNTSEGEISEESSDADVDAGEGEISEELSDADVDAEDDELMEIPEEPEAASLVADEVELMGETATKRTKTLDLVTGTESDNADEGWSYDSATGTLTLENVDFDVDEGYAIRTASNLNIVVVGNCSISGALGGIKCDSEAATISISVKDTDTPGKLSIIQKATTISEGKIAACIYANATGVSLNVGAPVDFVSNGLNSYTTYNLENITLSRDTNIAAAGDGFYNAAFETNGMITCNQGAKIEAKVAGHVANLKKMTLTEASQLNIEEVDESSRTDKIAVHVMDFCVDQGGALYSLWVARTVLQVENSFDVQHASKSNVHAFTFAAAEGTSAIIYNGDEPLHIYNGGVIEAASNNGDGLYIQNADLDIENGGTYKMLSPTYISDEKYYGLHMVKGDINIKSGGSIISSGYSEEVPYAYCYGILMDDRDPKVYDQYYGSLPASDIQQGSINVEQGKIELSTYSYGIRIKGKGILNISNSGSVDLSTYQDGCIYMSYYERPDKNNILVDGASLKIAYKSNIYWGSAFYGSTYIKAKGGASIDASTTYSDLGSITNMELSGKNTVCNFHSDGSNDIVSISGLCVTDGATFNSVGGIDINNSMEISEGATFDVKVLGGYGECEALELRSNSKSKITSGGEVKLSTDDEKDYGRQRLLYMNGAIMNIEGEDSSLTLDGSKSMYGLLMGNKSKIVINEGSLNCNTVGRLAPSLEDSAYSTVDIYVQNGAELNVDSSLESGSIIDGSVKIYVDNASLSVKKPAGNTDNTFSESAQITVKRANLVKPEGGTASDGKILNNDNSVAKGDIEITAEENAPGLYITKQPDKVIVGKSGDNLSTSVTIKAINKDAEEVVYQWYYAKKIPGTDSRNEIEVVGANAATLNVPNEIGIRDYYCKITLGSAEVESDYCNARVMPGESSTRKVRTEMLEIHSGTETQENVAEGWSWDKDKKKLVLDNVFFDVKSGNAISIKTSPITVEVKGECYLLDEGDDYYDHAINIYINNSGQEDSAVAFNGSGSLIINTDGGFGINSNVMLDVHIPLSVDVCGQGISTYGLNADKPLYVVSSTNYGIYSYGDISLSGDVYIFSPYSYTLYSSKGINLENCNLKLKGMSNAYGIYCSDDIIVSYSKLDIYTENMYGMYSYNGSISIKNNSDINIVVNSSDGKYGLHAYNLEMTDSKMDIAGTNICAIDLTYSSKPALIKNSDVSIETSGTRYCVYVSGQGLHVENSYLDIASEYTSIYCSGELVLNNSECNVIGKKDIDNYNIYVSGPIQILNNSEVTIDSMNSQNCVLRTYDQLFISESSLKITRVPNETHPIIYSSKYDEVGTEIKTPEGAYFDSQLHSFRTADDEYINELEIIKDTNPYVIPDKMVVKVDNQPINTRYTYAEQNSNAKMTAEYRTPNGMPTDLQMSWFKYDFVNMVYEPVSGVSGDTVSVDTSKIGRARYKIVFNYRGKEKSLVQDVDIVHEGIEMTCTTDDSSYIKLLKNSSEDNMSTKGWTWNGDTCELTLANAYFVAELALPAGTKVILAEGSENYIRDKYNGIYCSGSERGDIEIYGAGTIKLEASLDNYWGGVISGFDNVYIGPDVNLFINIGEYGTAVSTYMGQGKLSVNCANVEINATGENSTLLFGDLVTEGCDVTVPTEYYVNNEDYYLYTDSECTQKCHRLKIVPTAEPYFTNTMPQDRALFMHKDAITPITADAKAYNFSSSDSVKYEWYKVTDWYKANPQKVSNERTMTPINEIGEQLYYYKASAQEGLSDYSWESDVFSVCVMPQGRETIRMGLNFANMNTDTTDEEYETYGYRWDYASKTLTLDNVFLYTYGNSRGISVPLGSTISVADGSFNVIRTENSSPISVPYTNTDRTFTFTGAGTLIFENVNENYLFNPYDFTNVSKEMLFTGGVNVTFCANRVKGPGSTRTMQVSDGFTVDNATVNIMGAEHFAAINRYTGSSTNETGMILRNNAKLNIDCYGWAYYSGGKNVLNVDSTSQLNVVCKRGNRAEVYCEYGYYTAGTATINGKVNIDVETTGKNSTYSNGVFTANELIVGENGELNCSCSGSECSNPVVIIDGTASLNGKMSVSSNASGNALRVGMGKFNANAGSTLMLENSSNSANDLATATLAVVTGILNIYGNVEVCNKGGGAAFNRSKLNTETLYIGEGVTALPQVEFVIANAPGSSGVKRYLTYKKLEEGETDENRKEISEVRFLSGEEPTQMESVAISGTVKSGETLSATGIVPEDATVDYEWQYSNTPDGIYYASYYKNDTLYLDRSYIGKYIRLKVTGHGKNIGTVYSEVVGPVDGGNTDIKTVMIDSQEVSFGTGNKLYSSIGYQKDSVQIRVEPYDADSTVTINGIMGKTATVENLVYGYNNISIVVSEGTQSQTYTISIYRNTPPTYTLSFGTGCVLPEGMSVVAAKTDGTGTIRIPSSSANNQLTIYGDETYSISYEGSNEIYNIWAVKRNNSLNYFRNNNTFIVSAGNSETITVDADCCYVRGPENLEAHWSPNGRDTVKVSWNLPGGEFPQALSSDYQYNLVKVECVDPENDEILATKTQKSTTDTYVEFSGLDEDKSYNFVAYYANDTGKKYIYPYIASYVVPLTRSTTSVGACPDGYEFKIFDYETEKEVIYKAIKGYTDGEEPTSARFFTNLPDGITLGDSEMSCENPELISLSLEGDEIVVKPQKNASGSTYITLRPTIYGNKSVTQIRIDVFAGEVSAPKITKTTLSTNVYFTEVTADATERIFYENADRITEVKWALEDLNKYFVCEVIDDRSFAVLPNPEFDYASADNAAEIKKIKGNYKSELIIKSVKNPEGERTVPVTLKVTKKLPTVKIGAVKLNTFEENVNAPLNISCAQGKVDFVAIDESKTTAKAKACPDWITFDASDYNVTIPGQGGKYSGKLCLSVYIEGYNAPVAASVAVSATCTAPKVKLSASKLTLPKYKGYMTNAAELSLVSTDKKVSFESLNITDIMVAGAREINKLPEKTRTQYKASNSYKIGEYDSSTGAFTIVPSEAAGETLPAGKLLLVAYVGGKSSQKIEFTVTVANTEKVTIKPSAATINLDLAAVSLDLETVNAGAGSSSASNGGAAVGYATQSFKLVPSASGYNMGTFSAPGCETDTLKIEIKDSKGKESRNDELTIGYSEGVVTVKSNNKTVPGSYKLLITDRDGATCNLMVKANAVLPKYKTNANTFTLNRNISNDSAFVSIKADKYAKTDCTIAVCDAKSNEITENIPLNISWTTPAGSGVGTKSNVEGQTDWGWNIKLNDNAVYGQTYKLKVTYGLSNYAVTAKPMFVTVKVPAQNVNPAIKLKVTGAVDPARVSSNVVIKPTYTNVTEKSLWYGDTGVVFEGPTLVVTATKGKELAKGDYIGSDGEVVGSYEGDVSDWFKYKYDYKTGEIIISENTNSDAFRYDAFDASLTFNAKLVFPYVNTTLKDGTVAELETPSFKIPVKQNKINVSVSNNSKTSLCKADKDDRNYVVFKIDDASVSDIKSAKIFTKNGAVSDFELREIGNGLYSLGFTNATVSPKIKAETLTINFRFDGCKDDSKATAVKVKIDLMGAN